MECIINVSQWPYMQSFVVLTDFGFLIVGLKATFSQTGVVLTVPIMNTINECCRSYIQCKLRTPYFPKLCLDILLLVFLCDIFHYLPVTLYKHGGRLLSTCEIMQTVT